MSEVERFPLSTPYPGRMTVQIIVQDMPSSADMLKRLRSAVEMLRWQCQLSVVDVVWIGERKSKADTAKDTNDKA